MDAARGLLTHLVFMERRWFRWAFLAEQVDQPWGDRDEHGWRDEDDLETLLEQLGEAGRRTRAIVEAHDLGERSAVGGRITSAEGAPTLHWICLHVLQEYARHAGHLDIAVELATAD